MSAAVQQAPESAPSRPGVVVRGDLLPAFGVLCAVAVLGLPLGWLWSRLAPPELVLRSVRAATPGGVLSFAGQSEHRFDDMAVFLLLGLAAGVLTGAAVWMLRESRGPVVLLGATAGSLVAGWVAMQLGEALAAGAYGDVLLAAAPGRTVARPPVLESSWVLLAAPFTLTLTYSALVAWNGSDDLDRQPE